MAKTDYDRVVALAGLILSITQVRSIAKTGNSDKTDFITCIDSIFQTDAVTSVDVYDNINNLHNGLQLLRQHMLQPQEVEITRYIFNLLTLERKLRRKPELLTRISTSIATTKERLQFFPIDHENTIAGLADIYSTTVSTLKPKIMVSGEHMHLSKPENANRIRALLLAGIRAAVLWRQSGGNWFTLMLRRKSLAEETRHILATLNPAPADA